MGVWPAWWVIAHSCCDRGSVGGTLRDWLEYHLYRKKQGLFGLTAPFGAVPEKDEQGLSDCASQ